MPCQLIDKYDLLDVGTLCPNAATTAATPGRPLLLEKLLAWESWPRLSPRLKDKTNCYRSAIPAKSASLFAATLPGGHEFRGTKKASATQQANPSHAPYTTKRPPLIDASHLTAESAQAAQL